MASVYFLLVLRESHARTFRWALELQSLVSTFNNLLRMSESIDADQFCHPHNPHRVQMLPTLRRRHREEWWLRQHAL